MEEPLFDPSLKKRKNKKTVAFEDPLSPEADSTTPAPLNGDDVPTVHEQMVRNGTGIGDDSKDKEEEDFKAMFGDVKKKKKKKKEIPLDYVQDLSSSIYSLDVLIFQ